MTLQRLTSDVLRGALSKSFQTVHGWRGLFDSLCHEWSECPVAGKVAFLEMLPWSFEGVVNAYCEFYNERPDKTYVLHGLPEALYRLGLEGCQPALDYLETSQEPMIELFRNNLRAGKLEFNRPRRQPRA